MSRSVSTPVRSKPTKTLPSLHQSVNKQSRVVQDIVRGIGMEESQIFDTVVGTDQDQGTTFITRLHDCGERRHGMSKDEESLFGPYQLDVLDVASESSYSISHSGARKDKHGIDTRDPLDQGSVHNDTFKALDSHIGTDDDGKDDHSLLNSASTSGDEETPIPYRFVARNGEALSIMAEQKSLSGKRRATSDAHLELRYPNLDLAAAKSNCHLPLRSCDSAATILPVASFQARSSHNRAKSVTSVVHSSRHVVEAMQHPQLPFTSPIRGSTSNAVQNDFGRRSPYAKMSAQVHRSNSGLAFNTSTLAKFPIPPMDNPVGEIPMLISRATTSSQALHQTASLRPMPSATLEDTYRAITKVHMTSVLKRTRARGEKLQVVDWDKLPNFERGWRNFNEIILVAIYGRKDVKLEPDDVDFIDCICVELRNGEKIADWVRRMFEADG